MYMERHNEDTGQAKLTYALKEGRMVHIDSVENGLKCGCIQEHPKNNTLES